MSRNRTGRPTGRPQIYAYSLIAGMYKEGVRAKDISDRLGISHWTVLKACSRAGIDTSPAAKRARLREKRAEIAAKSLQEKQARIDEVARLYTVEFLSMRQVADLMKLARTTVYRDLVMAGVAIRGASSDERARVIAAEKARMAYLSEQRKERKAKDDARVARMMEIINRRPMRLSL